MNFTAESEGDELNTSKWLLFDSLNRPAIAVIASIEFLVSFILNLFIVVHALCHCKKLKKSSIFLLLTLAVANLLQVVLYMPLWIGAIIAGEWLYGSTDQVRNITCQLHGLFFILMTFVSLHTLAIISFDRFLSIVKPTLHKKQMSKKYSLIILAVSIVSSMFQLM